LAKSGKSERKRAGKKSSYTVRPIGWVRSAIKEIADDIWGQSTAEIELDSARFGAGALKGLDEYSHVLIVFVLDKIPVSKKIEELRHPRGRKDWPEVGIFAQRAKDRPNRIAVTVCKLDSVRGTKLRVRELDAIDGTPVLDIKPYLEEFGPRGKVRQAKWSRELMRGYFQRKSRS